MTLGQGLSGASRAISLAMPPVPAMARTLFAGRRASPPRTATNEIRREKQHARRHGRSRLQRRRKCSCQRGISMMRMRALIGHLKLFAGHA